MAPPTTSPDLDTRSQQQLAGAALQALGRAARSLVLYDAGNDIVRMHLTEYYTRMFAALESGEIAVTVAPFQFAVGGQIVLEDRDREKSLPFKLYRDGIRVVRILDRVKWNELLGLLRIVAIRYASVRQQEEDTVTLILRAGFEGIQIETTEGFTQMEEFPEPQSAADVERGPSSRPPAGWDTPLQKLPQPAEFGFQEIPEEALAALDEGGEEDAVADLSLSLASDLLAEAMRGAWPTPNRDLAAFFTELRDALLIDGKLARLRQLVDVLATAGDSHLRDQMLRGLADARTLEMVLATVPEDQEHLATDMAPFLPLLGVIPALEHLAATTAEGRRKLLTKVVLARLPRETDAVIERIGTFAPEVVRALVDGIAVRAPERGADLARQLLAQQTDRLRIEGLNVIETTNARVPSRPVCDLLRDASEAVRVRAAEILAVLNDASVVDPLCDCLEQGRSFSGPLAEAIGRTLARVAPPRAEALFAGWIEPKRRFLVGLSLAQRMQQWAAIAGTGMFPGNEVEQTLRTLADRTDGDVRRHCLATLARRRRGGDVRG